MHCIHPVVVSWLLWISTAVATSENFWLLRISDYSEFLSTVAVGSSRVLSAVSCHVIYEASEIGDSWEFPTFENFWLLRISDSCEFLPQSLSIRAESWADFCEYLPQSLYRKCRSDCWEFLTFQNFWLLRFFRLLRIFDFWDFSDFWEFYHRDRGFKRVLCAVAFGGNIGHICRRKIRRPRLARTHGALEVPTNIGRICQRAYLEIWGVFARGRIWKYGAYLPVNRLLLLDYKAVW